MKRLFLTIRLVSDATFGRGEGVAGVVDAEVQSDQYGLPYVGGKTVKGLLQEECANILFALRLQGRENPWLEPAHRLFGAPGSSAADQALLHVGTARLPVNLKKAVEAGVKRGEITPRQVLESLTAVRCQTAINPRTGAARDETLRTARVIVRDSIFESELSFGEEPGERDLALLAGCVMALRRGGSGRNRGRGKLAADLWDENGQEMTPGLFDLFRKEVSFE
ncbi:MAG: hypothetical protein M0Z41_03100 [Peptococcaceae bacterium]|jgi:hypothetical protein|nr:hypothetical protein [Peptococcaceae bacterium]